MISHLKKATSRQYPTESIIDSDNSGDLALQANTPDQAESLLHSREKTVERIGFYVNANKTENMYFKQKEAISLLNSKLLKWSDFIEYFEEMP